MSPRGRRVRVPLPREIWVLVGAAFVVAVGFGLVAPVLPAFARSFDVGVAAAGFVVSIFAFFRLIFAPTGGWLAERFGERSVYQWGLVIVALSALATAFAQSYGQLLLFRGLGGIGSTMFTISSMALLVRLSPPGARGRTSSLFGTSFLLGNMIGPVIGGVLAEFGMRVPFFVYAVALLTAATVARFGLSGARMRPAGSGSGGGGAGGVLTFRRAAQDPTYRAVLVAGLANGWVNFGTRVAMVPLLAVAVLDRPWVAGAALATGAVGTAVTLQFSGALSDRFGRRPMILIGLTVMGLAIGSLGVAAREGLTEVTALGLLLGLSLVGGVGGGFLNPSTQASVADIVGQHRQGGKVFAGFQMSQDIGAILGPIAIGAVVDVAGFGVGFALCGLICAAGVLAWARVPEPTEVGVAPCTRGPDDLP